MDQLSSPEGDLWDRHHEIVVVGTGYGGSIAASRLAHAGHPPIVLERGRELHPGDFPDTAEEAAWHVQASSADGSTPDRRGLFWLHVGRHMNVLTGCGLGGTSLINANVSIRPDKRVFDDERWPAELRGNPGELDEGYRWAARILQPTPYPDSYPPLKKVAALKVAAGSWPVIPADINVRFQSGPNAVGIEQAACTGCGDCVTGCNIGAKNTLLMNYLADAVEHKARIFTEIDVDRIAPVPGGGWKLWVTSLARPAPGTDPPEPGTITADMVVLAAGSLGSVAILLRSARQGLSLSGRVGHHFSANGDILGFAADTGPAIDGLGQGAGGRDPADLAGPCITAIIDQRSAPTPMIVEDAVIPGALEPVVPPVFLADSVATGLLSGILERLRLGRSPVGPGFLHSVLRHGPRGALRHTQTYLGMGIDNADGVIELDGQGDPTVVWEDIAAGGYYQKADTTLRGAARRIGGHFIPNPIWHGILRHDLITVHPLGGCAMADRAQDGVVDHAGRVFSGPVGTGVHRDLFVWDGSIVPAALGVNPLLTISALAERAVRLAAVARMWPVDDALPVVAPNPSPVEIPPDIPTLRFEDRLAGTWADATGAPGTVPEDFVVAPGPVPPKAMSLALSVTARDVRVVDNDPATPMAVTGLVRAAALSGDPFMVRQGTLQLRVPTPGAPEDSHMVYELPLDSAQGARYHLSGFKRMHPATFGEVWPDTTTLYVNIHRDGPDGPLIGRGILRVSVGDFAGLLGTMRVTGSGDRAERLATVARFGEMFAGKMFHDYGHVVHPDTPLRRNAPPRRHRPLEVPLPEVHAYGPEGGPVLRLTRYDGGTGRPGGARATVALSHGMGANQLSFSFDTIRPNLLEYLVAQGYDVWLQEWRGSTLLDSAQTASFTGDQVAQIDHPLAERKIREVTGRSEVHWVLHCVGALTFLMSLLEGRVQPASLVCSQMGLYPVAPAFMRFKLFFHLAENLRRLGIQRLTSDAYDDESFWEHVFDELVRLNFVPKGQRCDQAVCHRLAFMYGVAVDRDAVDDVTHLAMHELFGVTNLQMMSHLSACARKAALVHADGGRPYLDESSREKLRLPITFVHGRQNDVWRPETTARSFTDLVSWFGPANYNRRVFDAHGHQDCLMGASAWRDVYPFIGAHLEQWV